jgi:hypothetical protein
VAEDALDAIAGNLGSWLEHFLAQPVVTVGGDCVVVGGGRDCVVVGGGGGCVVVVGGGLVVVVRGGVVCVFVRGRRRRSGSGAAAPTARTVWSTPGLATVGSVVRAGVGVVPSSPEPERASAKAAPKPTAAVTARRVINLPVSCCTS